MAVTTTYTPITVNWTTTNQAIPITWPFFSGSLVVTEVSSTGVETVKTLTTHYTVSGGTDSNGLPATGTVTMVGAETSGSQIRVTRTTTKTQATVIVENDPFPAKVVEAALDKLTMLSQEGTSGGVDDITGDVLQLDSSGAQDFWDGEGKPVRMSFLELTEASAPSTPSSGYGRLYTKTDGDLYWKDDAGTEVNLSDAVAIAAASATAASASATAAQTAETNAETAETNAEAAQTAAEAAQAAAEAALVAAGLPGSLTGQALKVLQVKADETGYQFAVGGGDVTGPASSVDGEIALFDSTTGKLLKRASTTGLLKATSGVIAAAVAGTDYIEPAEIGVSVQGYDADTLKADTADVLTAGFAATVYNAGTQSSGTYTPNEANGNMQRAVNGGAHTLAPPTNDCTIVVQYTNNGSAGAITTSGFTRVTGAFTTVNGDDFMCYITRNNGFTLLNIQALQ